jgi:GT2 family glycosyltransferase
MTSTITAPPFVSIILVNYNGKHFLRDCLNSLENQTYPRDRFEVLLIDNGSHDESIAFLHAHHPWVRVIDAKRNLGFASGNNLGFAHTESEFVALLNNDTVVEARWLEALVGVIRADERIGAATSKILFKDRPHVINNAGLNLYQDGSGGDRGYQQTDEGQFDHEAEVFGACGASVLYRRAMLDEIGWLDDRFFMYYEDLDLAWRARLAGWRFVYTPASVVHHVHCGSSGEWSPFFLFHVERNRVLANLKNAPAHQTLKVLLGFAKNALRKQALVLLRRERSDLARGQALAYLKAAASLTWEVPGMLVKRHRIRRKRRVSDQALAQWIEPFPS